MDLKSTFVKALDYYDAGEFDEVILSLKGLLMRNDGFQTFPWDKVYALLGGAYYELENHGESIAAYKKALSIDKDLEMASLGLYLNYVGLQKVDKAIAELTRFLKEHKYVKKDDLKQILQAIVSESILELKLDFIESELEMIDRLLVLSDLNSRSQNILSYLLLLIYRKRNGKTLK